MAHIHSVYDTDTHFSIDPITRKLKNESFEKTTVIQHDHNSERFTFEIPRMVEEHDMSTCNRIEVHYINIDAETKKESVGMYIVDDMQLSPADENIVICSWLISQNATRYVGTLNYIVRFMCVTDSVIDYAWNTGISTIKVSDGIYNTDEVVDEQIPDVLTSWRDSVVSEVYEMVEDDVLQRVKEAATELMDDEATVASYTATAANWTAGEGEFTQAFTLDGVTAEMMVDVLVDDAVLAFIESTSSNLIRIENKQSQLIAHLKCKDTSTAITSDVVLPLKYYKVGIPEGQTSIYGNGVSIGDSAQSILEKLKTVDGTGSGLNADFLDGKTSGSFLQVRQSYFFDPGSDFLTKYKELVVSIFGDSTQNNSTIKNIGLYGGGDVTGIPEELVGSYWEGVAVHTGWLPSPVFVWDRSGTAIYRAHLQYSSTSITWTKISDNPDNRQRKTSVTVGATKYVMYPLTEKENCDFWVSDYPSAADAINAAIEYIGEGTVELKRGNYTIDTSNPIILPHNITLKGDGAKIRVTGTDPSAPAIKVFRDSGACTKVVIDSIYFIIISSQSGTVIDFAGQGENCRVENCEFLITQGDENGATCISVSNPYANKHIVIKNNFFRFETSRTDKPETCTAIYSNSQNTLIHDNTMVAIDETGCFNGIQIGDGVNTANTGDAVIRGNYIDGAVRCIILNAAGCVVNGNQLNGTDAAVEINKGAHVITGNDVYTTGRIIQNVSGWKTVIANNFPES